MEPASLRILRFRPADHGNLVGELTDLLHEAYAPLAAQGFLYVASHQPPERTLERMARGDSYLAFWEGLLVGTLSLYGPTPDSPCAYYRSPGVYHFGQFAVRPAFQGRGIADLLLRTIEERAKSLGGMELALDTSEGAEELVAMYGRRGFKPVSSTQWGSTNYRSIIMSKNL